MKGLVRWVVVAFLAVVATLALLSVGPRRVNVEVRDVIALQDATVTLFPASDPEAVWGFDAPDVTYDPAMGETTLVQIRDGERRVGSAVDFTLRSDELVIDRNDDLRGERMDVYLVEDELDVEMQGVEGRQVVVDHGDGVFEVPRIRIYGEDFGESRYEEMRVSFDFTSFEAGGPDTIGYSEFQLSERDDVTSGGSP